jgi:mono/diheme cytochrome c family protein
VIARFFVVGVLALAMLLVVWFGYRFFFPVKVSQINASSRQNSTNAVKRVHEPAKTNLFAEPPTGFYVGAGDQRFFVKYGTPDPVLQSFMQSVMDGSTDPNAKGREIFSKLCAACHQSDGEGKDGLAPPLVGSEWALTPGGGRMARIVLNGMTGPVQVRGKAWNLTMPPWRENLTDDQIAVVLTYVRSRLGGNQAGPITPEFVAAARKETHATPETSDELLRISDQ